jgi:diguanylate cyclase (GGDEF)-like protein
MKNLRILYVDDDDVDREMLRRLLAKLTWSIELHEASSLGEAKALLDTMKFDCVFLDYQLGDAIGFEVIPLIRAHREEICPIVMLSTRGDENLVVEAMREGIYDYISKNGLNHEQLQHSLAGALHWAERETELTRSRSRMQYLSLYDSLTELPNRTLLFDRLDQLVLACTRTGETFSLLMMDLNLFKEVNDSLGHDAGDAVLREVAQRLMLAVRKSDTVARLGGDEFACLLPAVKAFENAQFVAEKIVSAMHVPMQIDSHAVTVGISVGIAQFPLDGADGRTLLKRADQAMYLAKKGSRGIQVFSPEFSPIESASVLLTSSLERAVTNGELLVHFQPQINLESHQVIGKEALVRWQHPEQGMILPHNFIPAAEKSPAIASLTNAVLQIALDEEQRWRQRGFCVPVSVNLSARMLDDETLSTRILRMLSDRKLEPSCLILELTETALVSSPIQTRNTLRAMSEAGIRISIDDFGSGYTSFKQLRELEISEIKIDGMYVANITEQGRDASIVRSIVELGRGFDIHVIAECVEREKSWQLLQVLGCRSAQGYSIGKPMPREEFDQWMDGWAASNAPLLEHGAGVVRAEVLPLPDEWRA